MQKWQKVSKKIIFTDHSDSLLSSYLRDISKYKLLSNDEVALLVSKAQQGDTNARDKVVLSNLRFVVSVAKQFQNRGIPLIDLINSGNEGLITAVSKFDPNKGVPFISYAQWWIKHSIFDNIYWNSKEIRLPATQRLIQINILDTSNKFMQEHGRPPSTIELEQLTGIPREQIDYLAQFSNKSVSIDDTLGGDEENSQICDIIGNGDPEPDIAVDQQIAYAALDKCINRLTVREADVIRLLYGIGVEAVNVQKVCDMFGVGRERIRQIKEHALQKLRQRHSNLLKKLL